jgi:sec-independent protein translocase protein TatA
MVEANILGPDLLIILGIVVLIFGGSKIPELAKGLGQGLKEFKTAVKDDPDEREREERLREEKLREEKLRLEKAKLEATSTTASSPSPDA